MSHEIDTSPPGTALLEAMRRGGRLMVFRHMEAGEGSDDFSAEDFWRDCGKQRGLSPQGRADAQVVGAAVRELGLPVGRVVSSPLCRARRCAEALELGEVLVDERASYFEKWAADGLDSGPFVAAYRELLAEPPEHGTNTVVVTHAQRDPYVLHPVFDWMEQGSCAVFEPRAGGGLDLLGLVRVGDWGFIGHRDVPVVQPGVEP